jgi:hypothetical protein
MPARPDGGHRFLSQANTVLCATVLSELGFKGLDILPEEKLHRIQDVANGTQYLFLEWPILSAQVNQWDVFRQGFHSDST